MVQLLVQVPDVETLERLLDSTPLATAAVEDGVRVFVVDAGGVHEVLS